ncbi:maleylpyruvate isomerase family mycothiol-dependent enzyme [Nonomuraea turkmeniaca]|uniref:Maleylpyruvate isomerase family mycothiol-dependent enzyme n=1 Tax=Nonomuraea turkmeniaca TaxID=103838 RepID=A0A5S4EZB9_9ACTN|nr:maleylpyruvate isomerase family mycothiol-dependent enzyme [Nonomuraea turkmeniaca]TMR09110.1 maleylpyruvate isomerase family mycothiol-dependent enzyme [Nonomuraea turkmeniaca]
MDQETIWAALEIERHGLADLLGSLPEEDWERPSLCAGWRVRDVAAHLAIATRVSLLWGLVEFVRARGDFDRMIRDSAVRHARLPIGEIVEQVRESAGSHRRAPSTKPLDPLFDALVHGQDIAVPLGIDRAMPLEAARACATHIWERGFPFHPQRRLRGLRLVATDVDWAVGAGDVVEGPIQALLLLLSGRPAALPGLSGVGTAALTARLP